MTEALAPGCGAITVLYMLKAQLKVRQEVSDNGMQAGSENNTLNIKENMLDHGH